MLEQHHYEQKILLLIIYTFAISFCIIGVLLSSVFLDHDFLNLTFQFLVISLIPLVLFYNIDSYYVKHHAGSNFTKSHLAWITSNYVLFLILFTVNVWIITPLILRTGITFNFIYFIGLIWLLYRFIKGFNLVINGNDATHSKFFTIVINQGFRIIRNGLAQIKK